jgi:hypothetical protein
MTLLNKVTSKQFRNEGVHEKTRSKKRPQPAPVSCSPTPSRAKSKKGKQPVKEKEVQEARTEAVDMETSPVEENAAEPESPEEPNVVSSEGAELHEVGEGDNNPKVIGSVAGSQLTTGNDEEDMVAGSPRPAKCRRKQTTTVRFFGTLVLEDAIQIPIENLEKESNALATLTTASQSKR